MNKHEQLAVAISIATESHKTQFDKSGKPYILHPLHLMNQMMFDTQLATIAVLHDVIEDSNITLEYLLSVGISSRVVSALACLTHEHDEPYEDYIERICTNYDAIRVKRKDLEHNSNITRLKGITEKDRDRMFKYHAAFVRLTEAKREFERK